MPTKEKKVKKKDTEVTQIQVNAVWDVIDNIQSDLSELHKIVKQIRDRLGLSI
tara:strand:- start:916 stop:1074 length:159 start_codon:yes stop_codon:yes gene_type:complete